MEGHRRVFAGAYRGSSLVTNRPHYRFLRPDVAVAVQEGGVATDGGDTADRDRNSTLTYVFVRDDGEWKIASFQNTRVADPRE